MNIERMDLNLFVVFRAIYSAGSLTRAARQLHLSQPAISHALGRLREVLGDPLFVRQGHAMLPTPLARNLIEPVRQALQALEQGVQQGQVFDPAQSQRHFAIGMRHVLESVLLPPLLARLGAQAPGIGVSSAPIERTVLADELASGRLDLAVDVALPLPDTIARQCIGHDRLVVLARAHTKPLTLAHYLQARHVAVSARRSGLALEDMALQAHNLQRRIALRCQHYLAACQVVATTDLLLTMPASYAAIVNRPLGNAVQPLPLDLPPVEVYLYWHANATHDPANQWLRQLLVAAWPSAAVAVSVPPAGLAPAVAGAALASSGRRPCT